MADRSWWRYAVRVGCAAVGLIAAASLHAVPAGAYELLLDRWQVDGIFGAHDGTPDLTFDFNGGDLAAFTVAGNATESGGFAHLASPGVHNPRFSLDATTLVSPPLYQDGAEFSLFAWFATPSLNEDEFVAQTLDTGLDQVTGGELLTVAVIRLGVASGQFFSKPPGYYFFQVYANTAQTQTQIVAFNPAGITGDIVLRIDFHEPTNLVGSMVSLDGGTNFTSFATQVGFFNTPLAGRAFALGGMLSAPSGSPEGPFGSATCSDGLDNDLDGSTDAADSACAPPIEGPQGAPSCSDGIDNDGDQAIDNADPGCQVTQLPETCNGVDDDTNGAVDEGFPDSDGDGLADCVDLDRDNDGVTDGQDNCPTAANPSQSDGDSDGIGDACDANSTPIINPPSTNSIVIDGQFGPVMGEWIDITPASFLNGQSKVYSSTDPGQDAIYLMYDFGWSTTPLGIGDEAGDVAFQVGGSFFDVFFIQGAANTDFGPWPATSTGGLNDQVRILFNGLPFDNSAGCMTGAVDFNTTSPNFPGLGHNLFELEVKLTGSPGGCYSPEPAFWSATLPGVQPILHSRAARSNPPLQNFQISAAFVDIAANGSTSVTAVVEGPAGDPTCTDGFDNDGDGQIDTADSDCAFHLCTAGIQTTCRGAMKSLLTLSHDASADDKDKLLWKWIKGDATEPLDFGDPTGSASTSLCIYAGLAATPVLAADIGPDATTWQAIPAKGYKYSDPDAAQSGVKKALFKAGTGGKSKVIVKGKGTALPDPALGSLPTPITVQLLNTESGVCFESVFDAGDVITNAADELKLKTQ